MTSIFFTILGLSSQNSLYVFEASAMQVRGYPQKDLMDMLVRELKEDWRSWRRAISPSRQATRHGCAGGYTGARSCARILRRAIEWTIFYRFVTWVKLLPF